MSKRLNPEQIDEDNPEWTDEDFRRARPAAEVLPPDLYAALLAMNQEAKARRRGPQKAPRKQPTTIRFDADVLAGLKATGPGWQTRVNEAMREWLNARQRRV